MVKSDKQLYRFNEFQIDAIKRVLLRGDAIVQLPPKAFDVLLALVEHNQYVIEKDELMRLVWGERISRREQPDPPHLNVEKGAGRKPQ